MKKLLNTLYITTPDSYLYCQNETIAIKVGGAEKLRIPSHGIESIICFSDTAVSTPFIAFCGERGISLSFHSPNGRFYGRINGRVSGNVLLRREQFLRTVDEEFSAALVKMILTGKIANSKNLIMRKKREAGAAEAERLYEAAERLAALAAAISEAETVDTLRGIEGAAASAYFGVFDLMLGSAEPEMRFETRSRRPPENNINALLSFLYTLLKSDVQSALEAVGLDPAAGFLHTLRPGRPSLALDLMEELRAPLCDRLLLSLVNRGQIKKGDFVREAGSIRLSEPALKTVLKAWQERKSETIQHPFLDENVAIGLIPYAQAMLLARVFRGDLDAYPPFIWR